LKPDLAFVASFYEGLIQEVECKSGQHLTDQESELLRDYYRELCLNTKGTGYISVTLLTLMLKLIEQLPKPVRVLDAGCGLGTESILFGLLGAHVLGLDISEERVRIAEKRLAYYQEKFDRTLPVSFRLQNLLTFHADEKFDIIWNSQSISHIHPAEKYFQRVLHNLKNRGYFVIYESNSLNPYVSYLTWLVHMRSGSTTTRSDPTTGELVSYAIERIFNPRQLAEILRGIGFTVEKVEYYNFVPRHFNTARAFRGINRLMDRTPILRNLGATYVLVARKMT